MSIFKNADSLKILPSDNEELSIKEKTVLDMLYPNEDNEDNEDNEEKSENKSEKKSKKNEKGDNNLSNEPSKILKNSPKDIEKVWYNFNDVIIATILFVILNIPLSDRIVEKFVRIDNFYYRLGAKSLMFAILLFFINNFDLSRKFK
jgi:hypothetical protein